MAALAAARAYDRAASRYRFLALVYMLIAALAPLGLLCSVVRPAAAAPLTWSPAAAVLAAIAVVAALLCVVLVTDVARILHVKNTARPLGRLTVRRARLGASPAVATPTAIGYLHPAIVVPDDFRARVDAGEWEAVLAHECAHLSRGDDWAKALQSALLRIGWWLPGLWILGGALDLERELASDDRAAGGTEARRYAACLLRLATDRWDDAVAPGLWGRRAHLAIRVERLLRPLPGTSPVMRAVALGAFTAVALVLVAALVAMVPGGRRLVRVAAVPVKPTALAIVPTPEHRRRSAATRPLVHATPIASHHHASRPLALAAPRSSTPAPRTPRANRRAPHVVAYAPPAHRHAAGARPHRTAVPVPPVASTAPSDQAEGSGGTGFGSEIGTRERFWIRFPALSSP